MVNLVFLFFLLLLLLTPLPLLPLYHLLLLLLLSPPPLLLHQRLLFLLLISLAEPPGPPPLNPRAGQDLRGALEEPDLLLWSCCFRLLAPSEENTPVEAANQQSNEPTSECSLRTCILAPRGGNGGKASSTVDP